MIVLCIVELSCRGNLGGDSAEASGRQRCLVLFTGLEGLGLLGVTVREDGRPVLGSDIITLAMTLGWVVALPEYLWVLQLL